MNQNVEPNILNPETEIGIPGSFVEETQKSTTSFL